MKEVLLKRLREPSTWAGLMLVISAFGMSLTPEQQYALSTLGLALIGTPDTQHGGN